MTTGTTLCSRIDRHTLTPSTPGSMTSSTTRSCASARNAARPLVPSWAVATMKPSRSSESCVICRIVASSSTSRMRGRASSTIQA
jgi:hypothetical protein